MNKFILKVTPNALKLVVRPQPAIRIKIAKGYLRAQLPLSDILSNVTTAGVAVQFETAYTSVKSASGDYNLDIHCYGTSPLSQQGEVSFTVIKTPTGFNVFPDFDCALVTWSASPTNTQGVVSAPTRISGQTTSNLGDKSIAFGSTYAVGSYNVAYVRGYLTASPTTAVPLDSILKGTTGLTVAVPIDSVTIEWAIELTTQ